MKNVAVVLGDKLDRSGGLTYEFKQRLDKSIELSKEKKIDTILITGSNTRKGFGTEAEIAYEYIKGKVGSKIILEDKARTTIENVLYSQIILEKEKPETAYIITSDKRIVRVKMLYKKLSPDLYNICIFIPTQDRYMFYFSIIETIYYIFCFFDTKELTIASFAKKMFRNA